MEDRDSYEVCQCLGITYGEIMEAIKNGARSVEDIMDATDAGTVCGLCKGVQDDELGERELHLDEILESAKRNGIISD